MKELQFEFMYDDIRYNLKTAVKTKDASNNNQHRSIEC